MSREPITYLPVHDDDGRRVGWRVPDHEREWWDAVPGHAPKHRPVDVVSRDVNELYADLADLIYVDLDLESKLRRVHELNPQRVTRMVNALLADVSTGRLRNPAGLLWKRLDELAHGS